MKKLFLLLLFAVSNLSASWYNMDWAYRKKLSIDYNMVREQDNIFDEWSTTGVDINYWYTCRVPYQRNTFFAQDRYWLVVQRIDGVGNISYTTAKSSNNTCWSDLVAFSTGVANHYDADFTISFDGTYLHFLRNHAILHKGLFYRRGLPNADGTITWSTAQEQVIISTWVYAGDISMDIDSEGRPWIGAGIDVNGGTVNYPAVVTSTATDGTFIMRDGFIKFFSSPTYTNNFPHPCPQLNGKVTFVMSRYSANEILRSYTWFGSSWGAQESVTTSFVDGSTGVTNYNSISSGDNVYVVFLTSWSTLRFVEKNNAGAWSTETEIYTQYLTTGSPYHERTHPNMSVNDIGNIIYIVWTYHNDVYVMKRTNGVWDASPTKVYTEPLGLLSYEVGGSTGDWVMAHNQTCEVTRNNTLVITYLAGKSTPYTMKHLKLDDTTLAIKHSVGNMPVSVNIQDNSDTLFTNAQSDLDDVLFTTSDGVTKLDHEISYYNVVSGTMSAWVKVPVIYSSVSARDTDIYMYYGNPSCGSQQSSTSTWTEDYVAVWHFDADINPTLDSTVFGNNGALKGANEPDYEFGKLGGAFHYDGSNDYIKVSTSVSINNLFTNGGTVSGWVKLDLATNAGRLCEKNTGTDGWSIYWGANVHSYLHYFATNYVQANTSATVADWRWIGVAYNKSISGSERALRYTNDEIAVPSQGGGASGIAKDDGGALLYIGNRQAGDRTTDGLIDELRLTNVMRNKNWMITEYNSTIPSTFYTLNTEENKPSGSSNKTRIIIY